VNDRRDSIPTIDCGQCIADLAMMTRGLTMSRLTAAVLKAALPASLYYARMLPDRPATPRTGWVDGGLCPFHADRHRGNFRLQLDTGAYCCFACGAKGGDILAFHQAYTGLSFQESLRDLAHRFLLTEGDGP
jgi:hypothetical protein